MELHLKIAGALMILLALVHVIFPKYFDWENELKPLSLINRQLMYVHTFFVAFFLLLMGALCLYSSHEIVETGLGKIVALGFGIFLVCPSFVSNFCVFIRTLEGESV